VRITVVTPSFPTTSESAVERQVLGLAARGHQVHVIARRRSGRRRAAGRDPGGLRVTEIPGDEALPRQLPLLLSLLLPALRRNPGLTLRLATHLRRTYGNSWHTWGLLHWALALAGDRPDVLHYEFATVAATQLELLEVIDWPLVVSCRGSDLRVHPVTSPALARRLPRVFARADRVHCVSGDLLDRGLDYGLDRAKATVIRPSVDRDASRGRRRAIGQGRRLELISIGRLHWVKAHEDGLRAVRLLLADGHDVGYTIVGGGEPEARAQLELAARDLRLADLLVLTGELPRQQVGEHLAAADVFVLPSLSEGISNAALEAMAAGLPVVVTDVGGMRELVRDGVDGLLVPPRDPPALAAALARLLTDPDLRADLSAGARRRAGEFDPEGQIARFLKLYESARAARR
jgi:colanic acid/amylovoran biosynthesis glycosyltransferase